MNDPAHDPAKTTDLPATPPPDQTTDLPATPPPDQTTDLPAASAGGPDTGRPADTSVVGHEAASPNRTSPHIAEESFDPSRTGLHTPSQERDQSGMEEPDLPGYVILGELGRGGMGVVYKARQTALDRVVALKMILAGPHASAEVVARFLAEAQAVARFQHPNIVQIHEIGECGGMPYFSLEFVEGAPLSKRIAREPQLPAFAAEVVERLARAVQYAHERGIIHRDLKPANVLLMPDGTPKLTDFGLAKSLGADSGQTQSGQVLGTPSYMAPEQARGEVEKLGPAADVYGLGAILYDLLTGRPPFAGSSVLDTLEMVRTREPVSPGQLAAKVPRDLETICLKCLQKEPAKRYASAGELADDLRRYLDGRPIVARPVGPLERAWRWCRRNPAMAGMIAAIAVTLLGATGVSTAAMLHAQERRREAVAERDEKEQARAAEQGAKEFAEVKRQEAETALIEKEKARAAEEVAKQTAVKARDVAAEQRQVALDTIRTVLIDIDNEMRPRATLAPVRLRIIDKMLARLDKVRDSALKNPLADRTEALAYWRIGMIYLQANRVQDAGLWIRKAYPILKTLTDSRPNDELALGNLAIVSHDLGTVEERLGGTAKARDLHAAALKLRRDRVPLVEALVKSKDRTATDLRTALIHVADSYLIVALSDLRMGKPDSAVEDAQAADRAYATLPGKAANTWDVRIKRASAQDLIAHARIGQGRLADAEKQFRAVLADREVLLKITPRQPYHNITRYEISHSHLHLGDLLVTAHRDAAAAAEYAIVLDLLTGLLQDDPDNLDLRRRMAAVQYRLGVVAGRRTELGAAAGEAVAAGHFAQCIRLREELSRIDPKDTRAKIELMLALARAGQGGRAGKLAAELIAQAETDPVVVFQTACGFAVVAGTVADPAAAGRYRDRAFQLLDALTKGGWKDRGMLQTEPDLDPLRADPRFTALLARLK